MLSSTRFAPFSNPLNLRHWKYNCFAKFPFVLGLASKAAEADDERAISRSSNSDGLDGNSKERPLSRQWFALQPFPGRADDGSPAKKLVGFGSQVTAIKWIAYCCPDVHQSVILKLFSSRQVRLECKESLDIHSRAEQEQHSLQLKSISMKDIMRAGSIIYLPVTVYQSKVCKRYDPIPGGTLNPNADEIKYIRSLVLHKDPAIIVLNKPPKVPAQGSLGVQNSMDALAAAALSYDYTEGPRLVHRLDRESSGILVMGRTSESIALLHSLFHEKTAAASLPKDFTRRHTTLERRYWALVVGIPNKKQGVISAPLTKVVLDDAKSERIIIADNTQICAQEAITEYRVMGPSVHGCSWIELCPRTGRKHQLRVHCAEALGTPIVGDYKYGWYVHKRWKQMPRIDIDPETGKQFKLRRPHGFNVEKGSVLAKVPLLHLHCRELFIPNIAQVLGLLKNADQKHSKSDTLRFVAPLPSHMAMSWNIMSSCLV